MFSTTIKVIDKVNLVVKILMATFISIMAIVMIMQVFSRFVINFPLNWSEELARYLVIYVVFFGSAIAVRYKQLIAVEFLSSKVPLKFKRPLEAIVIILCVAFYIILLVQGIEILNKVSAQSSPALQISMAIPYAAIPVGAVLLIMNSVAVFIELFARREE